MLISKSVGALALPGLLLTAGLLGLATTPASADSLTTTISGFGGPFDVAVNPDGKFAYVLNHSGYQTRHGVRRNTSRCQPNSG